MVALPALFGDILDHILQNLKILKRENMTFKWGLGSLHLPMLQIKESEANLLSHWKILFNFVKTYCF